jgi:hypothetical protein
MADNPQDKLTDFITSGTHDPEQKTRIISREQVVFDIAFYQAGADQDLEVPHMMAAAVRSELLMMAYQGRRSDDIVTMVRGLEESQVLASGIQEITKERHARRLANETGNR